MKIKPAYILGAVMTMFMTTACPEKEYVADPDLYETDTERAVYTIVRNDLLSPSFRIIELAEVFSGYQEVRSEREKALRLVESYFNTRNEVYYEYMNIGHWGKIYLLQDGSFKATPDYGWRSWWIALNMPREVAIQSPQEHTYTTSTTSEDGTATWDMKATVEDYTITMTKLHACYEDEVFGTYHIAEIKVLEPLTIPMCNQGQGKIEPVSGKISIRYRSPYANREFSVEFHEYGKTFILPDGTTAEVEADIAYGSSEY